MQANHLDKQNEQSTQALDAEPNVVEALFDKLETSHWAIRRLGEGKDGCGEAPFGATTQTHESAKPCKREKIKSAVGLLRDTSLVFSFLRGGSLGKPSSQALVHACARGNYFVWVGAAKQLFTRLRDVTHALF